jgi:hypothetical protein
LPLSELPARIVWNGLVRGLPGPNKASEGTTSARVGQTHDGVFDAAFIDRIATYGVGIFRFANEADNLWVERSLIAVENMPPCSWSDVG